MYLIKILYEQTELSMTTENRNLARSVKTLCIENKVQCEVIRTVPAEEIPVKFRGID